MRLATLLSLILLVPSLVIAATATESWEGTYGPLAVVGTGSPPILAAPRLGFPVDPIHGTKYLELINNSPSGTPSAYVAWIKNLDPGETVEVSLYWHDAVPDTFVISAHWNMSTSDIYSYDGDAGSFLATDTGTGWDVASGSWEAPTLPFNYLGLVIEVPLIVAYGDTLLLDAMEITTSAGAYIMTEPEHESTVPVAEPLAVAIVLLIASVYILRRRFVQTC